MLKYYKPIAKCWINEKKFDVSYLYKDIIANNIPESTSTQGGWNEICEFGNNLPYKTLPWRVKTARRGLKIEILDGLGFEDNDIKQWETNLEFKFEVDWVECSPSINELLKYRNGEIAIRYIVERGLNIINKGDIR